MAQKYTQRKNWKRIAKQVRTEAVIDEKDGLVARFDGSCVPNPFGIAACACVVYRDGELVYSQRKTLGSGKGQTCNVSEFSGLLMVLYWIIENRVKEPVRIVSDSQIVVRRMATGTLPRGHCFLISAKCLEAMVKIDAAVSFHWQRRDKNTVCDALASEPWDARKDHSPWGI